MPNSSNLKNILKHSTNRMRHLVLILCITRCILSKTESTEIYKKKAALGVLRQNYGAHVKFSFSPVCITFQVSLYNLQYILWF